MGTSRQRERRKLRARFHSIMQSRKANRKGASDVNIESTPYEQTPRAQEERVLQYQIDSDESLTAAKRRRQGKLKTWAIWQKHMEARGYYFRTEKGTLSVYKDHHEVGQVEMFGSGPDA